MTTDLQKAAMDRLTQQIRANPIRPLGAAPAGPMSSNRRTALLRAGDPQNRSGLQLVSQRPSVQGLMDASARVGQQANSGLGYTDRSGLTLRGNSYQPTAQGYTPAQNDRIDSAYAAEAAARQQRDSPTARLARAAAQSQQNQVLSDRLQLPSGTRFNAALNRWEGARPEPTMLSGDSTGNGERLISTPTPESTPSLFPAGSSTPSAPLPRTAILQAAAAARPSRADQQAQARTMRTERAQFRNAVGANNGAYRFSPMFDNDGNVDMNATVAAQQVGRDPRMSLLANAQGADQALAEQKMTVERLMREADAARNDKLADSNIKVNEGRMTTDDFIKRAEMERADALATETIAASAFSRDTDRVMTPSEKFMTRLQTQQAFQANPELRASYVGALSPGVDNLQTDLEVSGMSPYDIMLDTQQSQPGFFGRMFESKVDRDLRAARIAENNARLRALGVTVPTPLAPAPPKPSSQVSSEAFREMYATPKF